MIMNFIYQNELRDSQIPVCRAIKLRDKMSRTYHPPLLRFRRSQSPVLQGFSAVKIVPLIFNLSAPHWLPLYHLGAIFNWISAALLRHHRAGNLETGSLLFFCLDAGRKEDTTCHARTLMWKSSSAASASQPLRLPPTRAGNGCFLNTTRSRNTIPIKVKSSTPKSCCRPMPRRSTQTGIPCGTPPKP